MSAVWGDAQVLMARSSDGQWVLLAWLVNAVVAVVLVVVKILGPMRAPVTAGQYRIQTWPA